MRLIDNFLDKFREKAIENSHLCDGCGAELFSYPQPRLCDSCLSALALNNGFTCECCGRAVRGEGVCASCKSLVPAFEKGVSPLAYFDRSALIINAFKSGRRYLAYYLAEEMKKVIERLPGREYVLTCVPITKTKRRVRGYNQAEELIKRISALTGYPMNAFLLEQRTEKAQKRLTMQERRKNVVGAFRVGARKFCKGMHFLLVDDVMTTGATLSEIASLLLRAGASSVCVATAASVPDFDPVDYTNLLASM